MAHILNYAEKYQNDLIELVLQGSLISPFMTNPTNIRWTGAKTFHLTAMNTKGYKEHSREGGWNRQTIKQTDKPFEITHDRDVEFLIDKADVDETDSTASIGNITKVFLQTQAIPEMDAYSFSTMASRAIQQGNNVVEAEIDKDTVYENFKKTMLPLRRYTPSLVGYATSEWMDALEQSPKFNRIIDVANINGPQSIETRIARVDGVSIIEVYDAERFMTKYNYTDGFAPASGAQQINFMLASKAYNFFAMKIQSIYSFAPGDHTLGDGYLYQNRAFWDFFTIENYKNVDNPIIDSVAVQLAPTA